MRAEPGVCHFSPILQLTRQLWRSVAREIFYLAMTPPNTETIRDLMLTIELVRSHFEHEETLSESAQFILDIATDRNAACAEYIPDYQQPSFWDDVTKILAS